MTLSLNYVFGDGSYQSESSLFIPKSSYLELSNTVNPSVQHILAVLLKRWIGKYFGFLEDSQSNIIRDSLEKTIEFDHSTLGNMYVSLSRESIEYKNDKRYRIHHVKINFFFEDAVDGSNKTLEQEVF